MKNTFGNAFSVTLFGESHGTQIGAVIDCPPAGIKIDFEYIQDRLSRRKSDSDISTERREPDNYKIISGLFNGYTTGTPLTILIDNSDTFSDHYDQNKDYFRPSHADYVSEIKYHGYQDYRGGGHFSGRITAPLTAVGAIAEQILSLKDIKIGTHISYLGGIKDKLFDNYSADIDYLKTLSFPVLDKNILTEYKNIIKTVKSESDSIGGILETAVIGISAGLGEPWYDTAESMLSHILFSVPGIKGIEFGAGFSFADLKGSTANDEISVSDGKIITLTNNNGGINGGITNGMPILFRCSVKPTPSINKIQRTINKNTLNNSEIRIDGRHDPCFVHRAATVVDSVTSICILDMLMSKNGAEWFIN